MLFKINQSAYAIQKGFGKGKNTKLKKVCIYTYIHSNCWKF